MSAFSPASTVRLLARALELLAAGERAEELAEIVGAELPAALAARVTDRQLLAAGKLGAGGVQLVLSGGTLAPGRVTIALAADGTRIDVQLDLAGADLPAELADLPLAVGYRAGELPSEHGWWSDVGGLLMLGELAATSA